MKKIDKFARKYWWVYPILCILFLIFFYSVPIFPGEPDPLTGQGNSLTGNEVLSNRLWTRGDGGRITIDASANNFSLETDGDFFNSASEDTTWGYNAGRRSNWRIKASADIWWKTPGLKNWHYLAATDTPTWFFNEQAEDVKIRSADTTTAQVMTVQTAQDAGILDVDTVTYPLKWQFNVDTFTFTSQAAIFTSEYAVTYDVNGDGWAIYADKTGGDGDAEPTGAIWAALDEDKKGPCDLSGDTTSADVADGMEACWEALTDWTDEFTGDGTGANATVVITNDNYGDVTAAIALEEDDGTGQTTSVAQTTEGYDTDGDYIILNDSAGNSYGLALDSDDDGWVGQPSGTAWQALLSTNQVICDINGAADAAALAALAETCWGTVPAFSTYITHDDTAADGTATATGVYAGVTTASTVYSSAGASGTGNISVAQTTPGVDSDYQNTYCLFPHMSAVGVEKQIVFHYNVGTHGAQPTVAGATDYEAVPIAYNDSANTIAAALDAEIDDTPDNYPELGSTVSTDTVTVTWSVGGQQDDVTCSSPDTVAMDTEGAAAADATIDFLAY